MGWKDLSYWLGGGVLGGSIGLLIWLYDYEFLLNASGPSTPISDFIRIFFGNLLRVGSETTSGIVASKPFSPILPLLVLIISLFILGSVIGFIVEKIKDSRSRK